MHEMAKKKSSLSQALLNAQLRQQQKAIKLARQKQTQEELKNKKNQKKPVNNKTTAGKGRPRSAGGGKLTSAENEKPPEVDDVDLASVASQSKKNHSQLSNQDLQPESTEQEESSSKINISPADSEGIKNRPKPGISMANKNDRVLLVGEGNFSFTVTLLTDFSHPGRLITSSTIDSKETVLKKYPDSAEILEILEKNGVRILFELDGCKLNEDKRIKKMKTNKFDKVIFNFPHIGGSVADQDRNIRANQILILRFLRSVSTILYQPEDDHYNSQEEQRKKKLNKRSNPLTKNNKNKKLKSSTYSSDGSEEEDNLDRRSFNQSLDDDDEQDPDVDLDLQDVRKKSPGTVLITAGTCPPYSFWDVPALAKNGKILAHTILYPSHPNLKQRGDQPTYKLIRSFDFDKLINSHSNQNDISNSTISYQHRQTNGFNINQKDTRPNNPRTWEFQLVQSSSTS
ncbi:hypothetical protein PSTT_10856 [Puccinia striiformis]|uniref:25S rRNA (uridine-N(3))-methyltransferase BMT5-like domain-containing protein n=1 Tax=Puccinia striiformis TaxID=27350 RepID=A0A2S4V2Q0_9BASI|nr:hypothetical protein PSTT_10856 [Puccinia striiformis]